MAEPQEQGNDAADEEEEWLQVYHDALQEGDAQAAEEAAMRFFVHACEQADREPSPDLLLKQEARHYEDTGQWHEAEAAYLQALALAQEQNNSMQVYKAQDDLSSLYHFLGNKERALETAQAALEAARLSDFETLLSMALEGLANSWRELGNPAEALQAANEMLADLPEEKLYELQRARALVLRAGCFLDLHQPAPAREDLDTAWPLLTPLSGVALFAGVQSSLANWWGAAAQLALLEGDFEGAVAARRKAVEYRRIVSEAPQLEGPYKQAALARALRKLAQALLAVKDIKGSEQAFRESQAIKSAIQQP